MKLLFFSCMDNFEKVILVLNSPSCVFAYIPIQTIQYLLIVFMNRVRLKIDYHWNNCIRYLYR